MKKPNHTTKDNEKALECLLYGLKQFYQNEEKLLKNDVSERCMVFKIAYYMLEWMKTNLPAYDLDTEYNKLTLIKDGVERTCSKRVDFLETKLNKQNDDPKKPLFTPDLIIHSRGNDTSNLAIIEFKKSRAGKKRINEDKDRLTALTKKNTFHYARGYLVVLDRRQSEITTFIHGEEKGSLKAPI